MKKIRHKISESKTSKHDEEKISLLERRLKHSTYQYLSSSSSSSSSQLVEAKRTRLFERKKVEKEKHCKNN